MTTTDKIRKDLQDLKLEKIEMQFPISYIGSSLFEIAPGVHRRMSARGAAYMNNRIRNRKGHFEKETLDRFSWKSFTTLAKEAKQATLEGKTQTANAKYNALATHINECAAELKAAGIDKPIYAIVVNNVVRGIPTKNFEFFDNEQILQQIDDNGLNDNIVYWRIGNEKFEVCFKVKSANADEGVIITVCLTNGHAGFDALRLDTILRNNKYNYVIPQSFFENDEAEKSKPKRNFTQRNRHLGWIEQVFGSIIELLDKVGEMNFIEHLKKMSAQEMKFTIHRVVDAKTKTEKRVEEILKWVTADKSNRTGFDVFVSISNYAGTRGYGASVDKILDPVLDSIFEELKAK